MKGDLSGELNSQHPPAMPMGDTRAIVLALQGLQEKVRKLEEDRNYHRTQCQNAHQAHEVYKREVEAQLDRERIEHRRREDELQSLLRTASTERRVLEEAAEAGRADLSSFREQLSSILESERAQGRAREDGLRGEVEGCRSELLDLRSYHEKLTQTLTQLKAERELVLATNKRLELTVADLIAMNGVLLSEGSAPPTGRGGPSQRAMRSTPRPASSQNCRRCVDAPSMLASQRIAAAYHSDPSHMNVSAVSGRSGRSAGRGPQTTYRDATVSSMARVVEQQQLMRNPSPLRRASPVRGVPRSRGASVTRGRSPSVGLPANTSEHSMLDVVYEEVESEYQRLIDGYKLKLQADRPSQNEINDLVAAIDQKADQLRLMRLARSSHPTPGSAGGSRGVTVSPRRSPRGTRKTVQRGALVNQLRNMLTS